MESDAQLQSAWKMQQLFDLYYQSADLTALVSKTQRLFNRPLLIHDSSLKVLAASRDIANAVQLSTSKDGEQYLDGQAIAAIRNNRIDVNSEQTTYTGPNKSGSGNLDIDIFIGGVETAKLVINEASRKFTKAEVLLAKECSKLFGLELQRDNHFLADQNIIPSHILAGVLSGTAAGDDTQIRERLSYYSWSAEDEFAVMVLSSPRGKLTAEQIPPIIQKIKAFLPVGRCTIFNSQLVAFLSKDLQLALVTGRNHQFTTFLQSLNMRAGLSLNFADLSRCNNYYRQAVKAAEFAGTGSQSLRLFASSIPNIVAELINSNYDLQDFLHPAVKTLLKVDQENSSELLRTLKYYIYFNHKPNEAAAVLNIHRNTLFYRLNRVKELTGISFATVTDSFQIYVSILLLEANNQLQV